MLAAIAQQNPQQLLQMLQQRIRSVANAPPPEIQLDVEASDEGEGDEQGGDAAALLANGQLWRFKYKFLSRFLKNHEWKRQSFVNSKTRVNSKHLKRRRAQNFFRIWAELWTLIFKNFQLTGVKINIFPIITVFLRL